MKLAEIILDYMETSGRGSLDSGSEQQKPEVFIYFVGDGNENDE